MTNLNIPEGCRILAKSNSFEYENEKIKIYSQKLSDKEYDLYLKQAFCFLLPYEKGYNYRTSAVLFQAVKMNKPILLLNNNTLSHYSEIFPNTVISFSSIEECIKLMSTISEYRVNEKNDYSRYESYSIANSISLLF